MRIPVNPPHIISSYEDGKTQIIRNTTFDRRVYPLLAGIVEKASGNQKALFFIEIRHEIDGQVFFSRYEGLETMHVIEGQEVNSRKVIGEYREFVAVKFFGEDKNQLDFRDLIQ